MTNLRINAASIFVALIWTGAMAFVLIFLWAWLFDVPDKGWVPILVIGIELYLSLIALALFALSFTPPLLRNDSVGTKSCIATGTALGFLPLIYTSIQYQPVELADLISGGLLGVLGFALGVIYRIHRKARLSKSHDSKIS